MTDHATTLAARKAMDQQLDVLIRAAAANVEKLCESDMEESQIRNVVGVAQATDSVEVVTNFIRYQIGRDTHNKTWGTRSGFGQALIRDIETGAVKKSVEAVLRQVGQADPAWVHSRLTALYLGYLNRCFVYAKKTNTWRGLAGTADPKEA